MGEMRGNIALGENYEVEVEQEMVSKPIMNATDYMADLFASFNARTQNRSIDVGLQIIQSGKSLYKKKASKEQLNRIIEIIAGIDVLNDIPINRRSIHRIPNKKYGLVCEGVGIILEIADHKGDIVREKQIRENTVIAIDGGLEGYAPASKNVIEQSDDVFEGYYKNE